MSVPISYLSHTSNVSHIIIYPSSSIQNDAHIILQNHEEILKKRRGRSLFSALMEKAHNSEIISSVHLGNMQGTNIDSKSRASTQPFPRTVFTEITLLTTSESEIILKFLKMNLSSAAF